MSSTKILGLGLLVLALAGCFPSAAIDTEPPTHSALANEPELTVTNGLLTYESNGSGAGMSAFVGGILSVEGGCLGLGEKPYAFPSNMTTWDGTTLTFAGKAYQIGDTIRLGGGFLEDFRLDPDLQAECGNAMVILVSPPN
jgi:hypothetical protein